MKIDGSEIAADGALGGKEISESPHAGVLGTDRNLSPGLTREANLGVKISYCETYDERQPRSHDEPTSDFLFFFFLLRTMSLPKGSSPIGHPYTRYLFLHQRLKN